MEIVKRKIEELGYDVLGLKEVQYVRVGLDNAPSCKNCTDGCQNGCSSCISCDMGGKG